MLPNIKSAKKRVLIIARNTKRNRAFSSALKTAVKKVSDCPEEEKQEAVRKAVGYIDKAVSKGILHKNTAARKKSSLVKSSGSQS